MTASSSPQSLAIRTPTIELAQLLKFAGWVESGGDAKQAIVNGLVQLNGTVETQKGKKVKAGDRVTYEGKTLLVTSE
jgi:ribosome-associated protein